MSSDYIHTLAVSRAKKLFTKEFFNNVTDSWYYDEVDDFVDFVKESTGYEPSVGEIDDYMGYMLKFKNKYYDEFFGEINARAAYNKCAQCFKEILETIETGNKEYRLFNVEDYMIADIKRLLDFCEARYSNLLNNCGGRE